MLTLPILAILLLERSFERWDFLSQFFSFSECRDCLRTPRKGNVNTFLLVVCGMTIMAIIWLENYELERKRFIQNFRLTGYYYS